jgi:hypothetical protein
MCESFSVEVKGLNGIETGTIDSIETGLGDDDQKILRPRSLFLMTRFVIPILL